MSGAEGVDARKGAGGVETEVGGAVEDGPSDPRARALRVPRNSIMGSSRFQQFFLIRSSRSWIGPSEKSDVK